MVKTNPQKPLLIKGGLNLGIKPKLSGTVSLGPSWRQNSQPRDTLNPGSRSKHAFSLRKTWRSIYLKENAPI